MESILKYCPHVPWPKQYAFLSLDCKEAFFGGSAGPGKALGETALVLTPSGFVPNNRLEVGQEVCNPDGTIATITHLHPWGEFPKWCVSFWDDAVVYCSEEHLWPIMDGGQVKIVDTLELASREQKAKDKGHKWDIANTRMPICQVQEFPGFYRDWPEIAEQAEDVDYYDAGIQAGFYTLSYSSEFDTEINDLIVYQTRQWSSDDTPGELSGKRDESHQREYRVAFLTDAVKMAHSPQRRKFLQGFMHAVGAKPARCTDKRQVGVLAFGYRHRTLIDGIAFIVRSLGGLFHDVGRDCSGFEELPGMAYVEYPTPRDLVRSKEDKERLLESFKPQRVVQWVGRLRETLRGRCITVSHPNGLFITEDFVVTHNSDALLMAALQYVHVPDYSALLLRKDFQRLSLPGAIMDRAREWLSDTDARWNSVTKSFRFPSGAVLQFGYIENPEDRYRYASAEFCFLGYDELSEFLLADNESNPYLFMFSRLRRTTDMDIPLRIRAASNPGNVGHKWVKDRFITDEAIRALNDVEALKHNTIFYVDKEKTRAFVPGLLADNPAIDAEEYTAGLMHLPVITRERLLRGDWSIREDGLIRAEWLLEYTLENGQIRCLGEGDRVIAEWPEGDSYRFATCDPAGTSADRAATSRGREHSHSVIAVWDKSPTALGNYLVLRHIVRERVGFTDLCRMLRQVHDDWQPTKIKIENEKLGVAVVDLMADELPIEEIPTGGKDKVTRAGALLMMLEKGEVFLPKYGVKWRELLDGSWLSWTGHPEEDADLIDVAAYAAIEAKNPGSSRWPRALQGSSSTFTDPPPGINRICTMVQPALEERQSSAIVTLGMFAGILFADADVGRYTFSELLERLPVGCKLLGRPPTALGVDAEFASEFAEGYKAHLDRHGIYPNSILAIEGKLDDVELQQVLSANMLRFRKGSRGSVALVNRIRSYPATMDLAPILGLTRAFEIFKRMDQV